MTLRDICLRLGLEPATNLPVVLVSSLNAAIGLPSDDAKGAA